MRINLVLPHVDLSGGIRVLAIYARHLVERGHRVVVVSTPRQRVSLRGSVKSLLRGRGWPSVAKDEPSHFDNVPVEHRVLERYRPITDHDLPDADVVVATWWLTAEWVAALSPAKGVKAYFVQHDERVMLPEDDLPGRRRIETTWSLPLGKITIAQWLVDLLTPYACDGPVRLAPNGVDQKQFFAPERERQAIPTVGMMYSRSTYKGSHDILRAFHLAAERVAGLRLVGFGTQRPESPADLPPGADYQVCPPQQELRHIYARCDAWIFGSRCEGFGLPILEAMACRTPVIGTPAGAAPELLAQGGGILVNHREPQAMADAITRLMHMPAAQWKAMSTAAWRTVAPYTWSDAAARFETALLDMAAGLSGTRALAEAQA